MSQELINGNWNQTISHQLEQLNQLISDGVITIDQLQAAIAAITGSTTVTVVQTSYAPQQTVYIEQNTPLDHPVKVIYKQQVITPQPNTVYLNNVQAKRQVCGLPSPKDEYYICAAAVDRYIQHLKDNNLPAPAQFTQQLVGYNCKPEPEYKYQGIAKVWNTQTNKPYIPKGKKLVNTRGKY